VHTLFLDTHVGKVQYRRAGEGPVVVYLHSAQGEGDGLEFFDLLAQHVDVVAPMFPGFGESEGIDQIDDMEDASFHLLDVLERLGLDRPTIAGTSLGGWMAAELATRYPERVGRLVLVNPAGLYIPGAEIKDIFGRGIREMVPDLYYDQSHPMAQLSLQYAEVVERRDAEIPIELLKPFWQNMAASARLAWDPYLHNPKLRKRLWRITAPTLVVRGAGDTLIPEEHPRAYAAEIPGAQYRQIEEVAHMVMIERPEALVDVIREFVGSASGASRPSGGERGTA
jgi:pimeloyl-ACP methyl ester carboxylesterase